MTNTYSHTHTLYKCELNQQQRKLEREREKTDLPPILFIGRLKSLRKRIFNGSE